MSVNASTVVERSRALPLRREWLALLSVLALGMVYDAAILFRYPFAVGVDGYYYILQVNELQTHGRLFFSTGTPLILYLLTGVSHLTGDPIPAVKIASITLHAALCGGVCGIILNLTRSPWASVLGATLAAISAPHLYMVAEGSVANNFLAPTFSSRPYLALTTSGVVREFLQHHRRYAPSSASSTEPVSRSVRVTRLRF